MKFTCSRDVILKEVSIPPGGHLVQELPVSAFQRSVDRGQG